MNNRIAPPHEMPTHANCCMWMGQFATMLEALNRHEADGGHLFSLCAEWQQIYRPEVEACVWGRVGFSDSVTGYSNKRFGANHSRIIEALDVLIADAYALYGYPPPEKIEIAQERIDQLRQYKIELAQCRERMEVKY